MTRVEETPEVAEADTDDAEPTVARWWQLRRWQSLAVACAVAATAVGATAWVRRDDDDLPRIVPEAIYELEHMAPGKSDFSMGDFEIRAAGKEVRVLSVEALTSPNVEYLGAYVVWPRDAYGNLLSFGPDFPDPDQRVRHPLGSVVPAEETAYAEPGETEPLPVTVTVGFRVLSGLGAVNGVMVTYVVDGKTKRQYYSQAAIACIQSTPCLDDETNSDTKALRKLGLVEGK